MTKGSNTRRHHYISACYLKNFASPKTRAGRIYSLDKKNKKQFPTTPNDAGHERDFNRVEVEGVHPNIIEDFFGQSLETDFSKAMDWVTRNKRLPGPHSNYYKAIIDMMALFAVRNPAMRSSIESFETRLFELTLMAVTSRKEVFDRYKSTDIEFEDFKKFVQSGAYNIVFPTGYHVPTELKMWRMVYPYLYNRKWELLISKTEKFITSNRPVSLVPTIPELVGRPIGLGLEATSVIFPLSETMCVEGMFKGKTKTRILEELEVSDINGFTVYSSDRFIFSTDPEFSFLGADRGIKTQNNFLKK